MIEKERSTSFASGHHHEPPIGMLVSGRKIKARTEIPYDAQVKTVQEAVDTYQKDTGGLLPIKTKEEDTPSIRNIPGFQKARPSYLNEVPGNAFESGGIFQYVIIDAEEDPNSEDL